MKNFLKVLFSIALKIVLFPLRICPLCNDRIVFSGLTGGTGYEYMGNPKYLCEYIDNNTVGQFEIVWLVSSPARYQAKHRDIIFVKHYSFKAFYYLMTTKIIVTNGSYAPWFPFWGKQRLINTWHGGGAYKKIENDKPDANYFTKKRAEFAAKNISLFVSSCKKATELLFRGTFLYRGEVLEVGMPRNDMIVKGEIDEGANVVREHYQIEADEKIVLYAPTYRQSKEDIVLDGKRLLEILSLGGQTWTILFRAHRYQDEDMHIGVAGTDIIDVADYPDMQELLCAADMVITDYSSLIWDYSFLERPCFLYVPDLEEYLAKTGFYVDITQWPFAMARTNEELSNLIMQYDDSESKRRIKEHHELMGNCETGLACQKVTEWILRECEQ